MATKIRINRPGRLDRGVEFTPEIKKLVAANAAIALGVSGGKDSCALAIAACEELDKLGHTGPRILIHSDLGRVEWRDSLPTCERLAAHLKLELVVVRRAAGDMMDRWLKRWENNLERYADLSCVKVILPWSTPSMRFCTSELKTAVICRDLIRRFPGQTIISCAGIRRDESTGRSKAPTTKPESKLESKKYQTTGLCWNAIAHWSENDVRAFLADRGFVLHEAYTKFGMSRVSCAFCIMGSSADLVASTTCPDNAAIYREMVDLEIASTFAFQGDTWLGDVAPHLLTQTQRDALETAKLRGAEREELEALVPDHLLYEKGWPNVMPTSEEAELLARVRREVAELLGLRVKCTTGAEVTARYAQLMAAKADKDSL